MENSLLIHTFYQSGHWIAVLDMSAWILIVGFSFAAMIKGSDDVRRKAGFVHWCAFRSIHSLLIFIGLFFVVQLALFDLPVFLINLIQDVALASLLIWRFIYKRCTKLWKKDTETNDVFIGLAK